jgi:hypothetical protein
VRAQGRVSLCRDTRLSCGIAWILCPVEHKAYEHPLSGGQFPHSGTKIIRSYR